MVSGTVARVDVGAVRTNGQRTLVQWFLTLLEVLNHASFISAFTEPFVIGKIKYFFKT